MNVSSGTLKNAYQPQIYPRKMCSLYIESNDENVFDYGKQVQFPIVEYGAKECMDGDAVGISDYRIYKKDQ